MPLKSVAFDCSFLETSPALATFSALTELRLWNLQGLEDELVAICKRSPTLHTLSLHFTKRPNLRILPVMLKHVPNLRQLSFHAGVGEREGDEGVTEMTRDFVEGMCPKVSFGNLKL
jgi:hypothetical protein